MSTIRVGIRKWQEEEILVREVTPEELREELVFFEHKYGLSSVEFYQKFKQGEIPDTAETAEWCFLYRFYLYAIGQGDYEVAG
jgi:hypothetical protein